jgi:hypothetical protein
MAKKGDKENSYERSGKNVKASRTSTDTGAYERTMTRVNSAMGKPRHRLSGMPDQIGNEYANAVAGAKATRMNAMRNAISRMRNKPKNTKISEPDMSGFTDTWRKNYIEKQRATRGGEPLFSTEQLSNAYREEQRNKKK